MKKIMFNDRYGLTQAVLDGRKTQTRRIIQDEFFTLNWDVRDDTLVLENDFGDFIDIRNTKYCMFKVGEIVAIAQSYRECGGLTEHGTPRWDIIAKAVGSKNGGWTNKMFVKPEIMPHQIRITNVRIERLQDISDDDCLKEGIIKWDSGQKDILFYSYKNANKNDFDTPREAYSALIDKICGKGTWDRNPYVFAYDFELIK